MNASVPKSAFESGELLYRAGLLIDEVSNRVLCFGLIAEDGKGTPHQGWHGFAERMEPLQITLYHLSRVEKVSAPSRLVYVVENPSVFATILDKYVQNKTNAPTDLRTGEPLAMVCTYGQINVAGLVLLDFLTAAGATLCYAGDYDPEGIAIADRLKTRYKEHLVFWRYETADYQAALSGCALNATRLKQLENIRSPELLPLVRAVKNTGLCGYQELILDVLEQDLFGTGV